MVLFSYEHEHIWRFSNLHYRTFKSIQQMIFILQEKLVLTYKFCAFYMFIFDKKKVMNYIKSKTEFFQTAVKLGAENFRKIFWEGCALSGPHLSRKTELFWRRLP